MLKIKSFWGIVHKYIIEYELRCSSYRSRAAEVYLQHPVSPKTHALRSIFWALPYLDTYVTRQNHRVPARLSTLSVAWENPNTVIYLSSRWPVYVCSRIDKDLCEERSMHKIVSNQKNIQSFYWDYSQCNKVGERLWWWIQLDHRNCSSELEGNGSQLPMCDLLQQLHLRLETRLE